MRLFPLTLVALVVLAALAPAAHAGLPGRVTTVDLVGGASKEGWPRDARFTMAGVHWRGPGRVELRTRSLDGRWSVWRDAAPEAEDLPDPGSPERRARAGWRIGNPWWTGPSDRLQVRLVGRVTRAKAVLVWSPEVRIPYRRIAAPAQPAVVPRATWGANESLRKAAPVYAARVRFAIVHHTAGRNDYTRAEAPAIVRAIQLFHVRGNGWNDIGYNFLIDRFGTVYEGRFGGIDRNVVGAHALGFNSGSVGVALLGTYEGAAPSTAAQKALAELLAWRLDLAYVDPTSVLTVLSSGSEKFAKGTPVQLRAVSGHRDTGSTLCPGRSLYQRLDAIAGTARRTGGAKIFDPRVASSALTHRFQAGLISSLRWSVTVTDAAGNQVARGTGTGAAVDWTWNAAAVPPAVYSWTIEAGSARPANGTLRTGGGAAAVAIEEAALQPASVTPNADGQNDEATLTYRLPVAANVTVAVLNVLGEVVATPVDRVWTRAGQQSVTIRADELADARYTVLVTAASSTGQEAQATVPLTVNRALGLVTVAPAVFSPNGDRRRDTVTISFSFATPGPAPVRIRVLREGRGVALLLASELEPGAHRLVWSGLRETGAVRDGTYEVVVELRDPILPVGVTVPVAVDTLPPALRVLPGKRFRLEVSEPALLTLRVDGVVTRRVVRAGVVRLPTGTTPRRVWARARDEAGNVSAPLVWTPPRVARPAGK